MNGEVMKIRIGFGLGTQTAAGNRVEFNEIVDGLEDLRFDSLWMSERVNGPAPDPMVAMTWAAARTERLKIGAGVMVLPGRNPVLLAKAVASLDVLSNGRMLPAFGLGIADAAEQQAFGVHRKERAAWFNEALPLLRRLWTEESVTHSGDRFTIEDARVLPKPVQDPLEVWLGGRAPSELRRVGQYSDGWLPSFTTPDEMAEGMEIVNGHAKDADRKIDDEHFGVLVAYTGEGTEMHPRMKALAEKRHPGRDPRDIIPAGHGELRDRLEGFIKVGASKFVVLPVDEPTDWASELETLAAAVLPLEN